MKRFEVSRDEIRISRIDVFRIDDPAGERPSIQLGNKRLGWQPKDLRSRETVTRHDLGRMTLPEYPSTGNMVPVMINMPFPAKIEKCLAFYLTFVLLSHVREGSISHHHDANP